MKKTTKITPVFVADFTNVTNVEEAINAMNTAKSDSCANSADIDYDVIIIMPEEKVEKKLSWYKRFWNWITRKK